MFPPIPGSANVTSSSGAATVSISYPPSEGADVAPEKRYNEEFSKPILNRKFEEFKAGKLTHKYMTVYLDFMHISGFISNLDYLEYKPRLKEELQ